MGSAVCWHSFFFGDENVWEQDKMAKKHEIKEMLLVRYFKIVKMVNKNICLWVKKYKQYKMVCIEEYIPFTQIFL